MRLIDADALFEKIKNASKDAGFYTPIYNGFLAGIVNAPTIEAEPVKHGRWIKPTKINGRSFSIVQCSVCGGDPCGVDENIRYCPNCGCKMDLEGEL